MMISKSSFVHYVKRSSYIIACLILLCACKKYKEGPKLTLRSVKGRITGTHIVSSLTVDGIDKLEELNDSTDFSVFRFYIERKERKFLLNKGGLPGFWRLSEDKDSLFFYNGSSSVGSYGPFFKGVIGSQICKLTNKQMKLSITYDSQVYVLELERVVN